jgi:hypothetical protein
MRKVTIKPKIETLTYLDLFDAMYYVEGLGHPGFKENFWDDISDDIPGNDCYWKWYPPSEGELRYLESKEDKGSYERGRLFGATFGISDRDGIVFHISW